MKPVYFSLLTLLTVFSCASPETKIAVIEKYENGSVKIERQFKVANNNDSTAFYETVYFEDGSVKMEGGLDENGERHGEWKAFFTNGKVWSTGSFNHGKRDGKSVVYFPNGQKRTLGAYSNGKQSGTWKFWNEDGKALEEKNFGVK